MQDDPCLAPIHQIVVLVAKDRAAHLAITDPAIGTGGWTLGIKTTSLEQIPALLRQRLTDNCALGKEVLEIVIHHRAELRHQ
jgi:hypothetical protein